jgi:hypothetical protein
MQTEYTIVYSKEVDDKQASLPENFIELPPWSQVDPLTLLELPKDYQEQILKSYVSKVPTKSEPSIKPKTKEKAPENVPYDVNVLNELPKGKDLRPFPYLFPNMYIIDIRDQVIKEYRKKPEPKRPMIQVPAVQVKNNMLKTKPLEPKLHGYTDIQDIRSMLLQWLTTFNEPEPEDINTLIDYLIELVHFRDLEKVQQCIRYLLRNVEQSWMVWVEEMIVQVNEVVVSIYKCPLKF